MFVINKKENKDRETQCIEMFNSSQTCFAKIDLQLGGSIQELRLDNKPIISSEHVLPYKKSYASAVLFPFANRIEDGKYVIEGKTFQLELNEESNQNAIHGLVYNKTFTLMQHEVSTTQASVSIGYIESTPAIGFPFKYAITLNYVLTKNELQLYVNIKNLDEVPFPFSLGWHPYFYASDLSNCELYLNTDKKIVVNNRMIPVGDETINWKTMSNIKNQIFDDCFVLNNNLVKFKTPEYQMAFMLSTSENYLQIYIPENRQTIAIEPQTAPANSFNSNIGLLRLQPNETFSLNWKIKIELLK